MISIGNMIKQPHLERKPTASLNEPSAEWKREHQHFWCKLVCTKSLWERSDEMLLKSEEHSRYVWYNIWNTWLTLRFFEKTQADTTYLVRKFSLDSWWSISHFVGGSWIGDLLDSGRGRHRDNSRIRHPRRKIQNRRNRSSNNHQPTCVPLRKRISSARRSSRSFSSSRSVECGGKICGKWVTQKVLMTDKNLSRLTKMRKKQKMISRASLEITFPRNHVAPRQKLYVP